MVKTAQVEDTRLAESRGKVILRNRNRRKIGKIAYGVLLGQPLCALKDQQSIRHLRVPQGGHLCPGCAHFNEGLLRLGGFRLVCPMNEPGKRHRSIENDAHGLPSSIAARISSGEMPSMRGFLSR